MSFKFHARRSVLALSALGLMGALGACSDLLEVEDPGRVTEPTLADSTIISELAASGPGLFNSVYASYAYASAVFTDEAVSGHNFSQWQDVDARLINDSNADYANYGSLHRLRFTSSNFAQRMEEMLGERANSDARVALNHALHGYALILLADAYCESPLGPDQAASTPEQIYTAAIAPLERALAIATAAGNASVQNLARVGLARAYINLNNKAKAVEFASQVPANFIALARSSDALPGLYSPFVAATQGTNHNLGVDPKWLNMATPDPRIQYQPLRQAHNVDYRIASPYQPPSFSGYNPTTPALFANATDIRYASGLEAQYLVAEATGPNATTVAFVNTRRAIGGLAPLDAATVTPTQFQAALLDQRARDFYLDGHRIGDLRRFKRQYGINEFPMGENPNPGSQYVTYEDVDCFAVPRAERIGNDNYNP